jgi:hypothetical protein
MRIHTDTLTTRDIFDASRIARVTFDRFTEHGSRSRKRAFDVTLTGESNRRPNNGTSHQTKGGDDFAATWDQWGVFLAVLFSRDPDMVTPYYADANEFHGQTAHRFDAEVHRTDADQTQWWPTDAHGDHHFKYDGTPYEQKCTKCTAVRRWQ